VPDEEYYIELGKADIKKQGKDVTIVSYNKMMESGPGRRGRTGKKKGSARKSSICGPSVPLDWMTILERREKDQPACDRGRTVAICLYFLRDHLPDPERRFLTTWMPLSAGSLRQTPPLHYAPNLVALALPDVGAHGEAGEGSDVYE